MYSISLIINVRERKFQGTKVPPMELLFPGTKVLQYRIKVPATVRTHAFVTKLYTLLPV